MKCFLLFISLILFHSSLLFPESISDLGLPQDLIYNNQSIDPRALLNACFNKGDIDPSQLIENPTQHAESQEKNPLIKVLEKEFIYDQKKVAYEESFQIRTTLSKTEEAIYEGEYTNHSSYEYLGSAGNKHILKTLQYDTSGHGNDIHTLLSLTKNPDRTLHADLITAGSHWEGLFNVHSIKNGYLTYGRICFPADFIGQLLTRGEDGNLEACCSSRSRIPFEVLYEYDLEKFEDKISGLLIPGNEYIIDEFNWDFESTHQEDEFFVWALNEALKEYIKQGKTQLDFEEACTFAEKVASKIDVAEEEFLARLASYKFKNCNPSKDLL